jgi:hypothetical protein
MKRILFLATVVFVTLVSCDTDNTEQAKKEEELREQRLAELKRKEQEVQNKNSNGTQVGNKNHRAIIQKFFEAEKDRNLEEIMSFYSNNIRKYYSFSNPSFSMIRSEYEASWRKTDYAINENPVFQMIDEYTYNVKVDYRFYLISSQQEKTIVSNLRFVFDDNGKIKEVYSL